MQSCFGGNVLKKRRKEKKIETDTGAGWLAGGLGIKVKMNKKKRRENIEKIEGNLTFCNVRSRGKKDASMYRYKCTRQCSNAVIPECKKGPLRPLKYSISNVS